MATDSFYISADWTEILPGVQVRGLHMQRDEAPVPVQVQWTTAQVRWASADTMKDGIWFDANRKLHHVIVAGFQRGLWSKRRWAKRQLRREGFR